MSIKYLSHLSGFENWILNRIIKKTVLQGNQDKKIQDLYGSIIVAAKEQYTEDNDTSLRTYLEDMHGIEANKHFEYAQNEKFKQLKQIDIAELQVSQSDRKYPEV